MGRLGHREIDEHDMNKTYRQVMAARPIGMEAMRRLSKG
jgi:hypothetical protein